MGCCVSQHRETGFDQEELRLCRFAVQACFEAGLTKPGITEHGRRISSILSLTAQCLDSILGTLVCTHLESCASSREVQGSDIRSIISSEEVATMRRMDQLLFVLQPQMQRPV